LDADVYLLFGPLPDARVGTAERALEVRFQSRVIPIYGPLSAFDLNSQAAWLQAEGKAAAVRSQSAGATVWRIGYDLLGEVRQLLTVGQPEALSGCPTLELHIEIFRELLKQSGAEFVEIPPVPAGHDFFCCLTHDIDFYGIRRHGIDRTMAGFLSRASFGSLRDLVVGRRTFSEVVRNVKAVLTLPLIFLGAARDFWRPFDDYAAADGGRDSTFFLVPFKGRSGAAPDGRVESARAVPYDLPEIADDARNAAQRGSELAVHGLNAWSDPDSGREEKARLLSVSCADRCGIRMHWLYFNESSPVALEAAGYDYDSTWGYNGAIGYRAGTLQPFRFPGTQTLLELPLAIMDSALFSGGRMALSAADAERLCGPMIDDARRFGGALVINWHDRSLAPERLWGRAYRSLLDRVSSRNHVSFATAQKAVDWFRWRRSICFANDGGVVRVSVAGRAQLPGIIRVHRAQGVGGVQDILFPGGTDVDVELNAILTQQSSNSIH
jgi:hypothetical protein